MNTLFDLNTLDIRSQANKESTVQPDSTFLIPSVIASIASAVTTVSAVYSAVTGTSKNCL